MKNFADLADMCPTMMIWYSYKNTVKSTERWNDGSNTYIYNICLWPKNAFVAKKYKIYKKYKKTSIKSPVRSITAS